MTDDRLPQEHLAAARQLYAIIMEYMRRPAWTPLEGALIMSGIQPTEGFTQVPTTSWTGLDGWPQHGDPFGARRIMEEWEYRCEDERELAREKNRTAKLPTELPPFEFVMWCLDSGLETKWMHHFKNLVRGRAPGEIDAIPLEIIEYTRSAIHEIDKLRSGDAHGSPQLLSGPSTSGSDPNKSAEVRPMVTDPMGALAGQLLNLVSQTQDRCKNINPVPASTSNPGSRNGRRCPIEREIELARRLVGEAGKYNPELVFEKLLELAKTPLDWNPELRLEQKKDGEVWFKDMQGKVKEYTFNALREYLRRRNETGR